MEKSLIGLKLKIAAVIIALLFPTVAFGASKLTRFSRTSEGRPILRGAYTNQNAFLGMRTEELNEVFGVASFKIGHGVRTYKCFVDGDKVDLELSISAGRVTKSKIWYTATFSAS